MLNASDEDYKTAVAANLIQHRSDISDISATLNDTAAVNGNSGVLETQDWQTGQITTQTARIDGIGNNGFTPGACTDGTHHWVFVVGTDNACWYRRYSGGWGNWTSIGGAFSSGLAAYCVGTTQVHVYGRSTTAGDTFHRVATNSGGNLTWAAWENLHGNIGGLGQ